MTATLFAQHLYQSGTENLNSVYINTKKIQWLIRTAKLLHYKVYTWWHFSSNVLTPSAIYQTFFGDIYKL